MPTCSICQAANAQGVSLCQTCGASLGGGTGDATTSVAYALPTGTILQNDAFRIDGVLGQGGFGITYRGTDLRLDRQVAVKEFFPFGNAIRIQQDNRLEPSGGLSRSEFDAAREAFFDEARTLARFSHAHIVNVFTVFEEKNTTYMVMEFLAGQSLQARIEARHALGEDEALHIIEQVGPALEVVHAAGLLHRDLKPDNILLCADAFGSERAVLLDFGSARTYTAGQTQNFDRLLTPGYAPLEQYSSSARFDVYTDIYSLGATLYQSLTGRVPPAATDRAGGVELLPPHQLNPQLSRIVSDATLWALSLGAADRPQSVREFLTALRSTKDSSHNTSPSASRPPGQAATSPGSGPMMDPRATRLAAIMKQLADGPAPCVSPHDAQLREVEERLARVSAFRVPPETTCPACAQAALQHIPPAVGMAHCPLCDGKLTHRHIDQSRCPVCREGTLKEYVFPEEKLFCPLCRVAPLREEQRKKLGLPIDTWLCCPACKAEWDAFPNRTAKLMTPGNQTRGGQFLGQTKPIAEWKQLAARAGRICRCDRCAAQFDLPGEERMTLVLAPADPHGIAGRYPGKTFFRRAWARLAHNLALGAGDCVCGGCRAEWNLDAGRQTLKLLQCVEKYAQWKGQTHGLSEWKYLGAGKRSGRAGYKCRNCATEFDNEGDSLRLTGIPPGRLAKHTGRKLSLADWQRIAAGVPDSHEEAGCRQQRKRLQTLRDRDTAEWQATQNRHRQNLERELDGLARQSFLEGYLKAADAVSMQTSGGEQIRWLSSAVLLRQRTSQGLPYWDTDRQGALMITDNRLVFLDAPGVEHWARPLGKIQRVDIPYLGGQPLLELHFHDLKNPVGFLAAEMALEVMVGAAARRLLFPIAELASWLGTKRSYRA